MGKEEKDGSKSLVNRQGRRDWREARGMRRIKLYQVQVQIPYVECDHYIYLKYTNKIWMEKNMVLTECTCRMPLFVAPHDSYHMIRWRTGGQHLLSLCLLWARSALDLVICIKTAPKLRGLFPKSVVTKVCWLTISLKNSLHRHLTSRQCVKLTQAASLLMIASSLSALEPWVCFQLCPVQVTGGSEVTKLLKCFSTGSIIFLMESRRCFLSDVAYCLFLTPNMAESPDKNWMFSLRF